MFFIVIIVIDLGWSVWLISLKSYKMFENINEIGNK